MRVKNCMLRNNTGVYCLDVLDNIHPQPLGFLISKMEVFQANIRDNEALSYIIFYYGLYVLKDFFSYRLLINSRKRFWGRGYSFRIMIYALNILIISASDFAY